MFGSMTSASVKCARCSEPLGATGTFTVIGADWYHSWCAAPTTGNYEATTLQKLYGDKSEQYVSERLAHEATKKLLSVSEKRAEEAERERDEEREARRELDKALDRVLKQRDDAVALGLSLKLALAKAESERDSSQASLLRVVEALKQIADLDKHGGYNTACGIARTALSPHTEK